MNTYLAIDVYYIRGSRTIEIILLDNGRDKTIVYVYNHDGLYFYYFRSIMNIINYLNDKFESEIVFEDEEELGEFLEKQIF